MRTRRSSRRRRPIGLIVSFAVVLVIGLNMWPMICEHYRKEALFHAVWFSKVHDLQKLLATKYDKQVVQAALNQSLRNCDPEIARTLLDFGANPIINEKRSGFCLIHCAIMAVDVDPKNAAKIVDVLLMHGAKPNVKCGEAFSVLGRASLNCQEPVVKVLIDRGADVNLNLEGSGTALCAAIEGGDIKTVKMLLDAGADPYQTDGRGTLPIDQAYEYHHPNIAVPLSQAMTKNVFVRVLGLK